MREPWLVVAVDLIGKLLWLAQGYLLLIVGLGGLLTASHADGWPHRDFALGKAAVAVIAWAAWGYIIVRRKKLNRRRRGVGFMLGLVSFVLLQPLPK